MGRRERLAKMAAVFKNNKELTLITQPFINLMIVDRFIKVLDRGDRNCCSRCDLIFKPLPSSALAKKREERAKKQAPSAQPVSSQSSHQAQRDERPRDVRHFILCFVLISMCLNLSDILFT